MLLLTLSLSCVDYGYARKQEREVWTQPSREAGLEVLWVLDDSLSMLEEQALLAEHAQAFTEGLSRVDVDFRLGVVSTDMERDPGGLVGPWLLPGETLDQDFGELVLAQSEGARQERGFDAALAVLGELRAGADLELLFFSDEDDQSLASPAELLQGLESADQGLVAVNAIVGDPPQGCASTYAAADAAPRYLDAVALTEGSRESICSLDYERMLSRMALHVLGLEDQFVLGELPELETMEVTLEDSVVPRDPEQGWSYDAGENMLVLSGEWVPRPGETLIATYYQWYGAWGDRRDQEAE